MPISIKNKDFNKLLKQLAVIDYDKIYTPLIRLLCHVGMWLFFSILLFLYYNIELKLSNFSAFILTLRAIVSNISVFYFFFYLFPLFYLRKNIVLNIIILILGFFICIIIWLFANHMQLVFFSSRGFEINDGPLAGVISKNAEETVWEAISFKKVVGNANFVIFYFIPTFFVKFFFDTVRVYGNVIKIEKQKLDLEIQNINIEKDFLKAQLNPHFLFNTMNNLYGLTVRKDDEATDVVLNLSDIMAYTLYESNSEKVPLEKELEFIQNYFSLEKMRYSKDAIIEMKIEGKKFVSLFKIAPLLTFAFIENGFKYGLKSSDPFLKINIKITEIGLEFYIENDFCNNQNRKKNTNIGGIGLENVKKRLNLLYPDSHSLCIDSQYNTYKVSLKIQLNNV